MSYFYTVKSLLGIVLLCFLWGFSSSAQAVWNPITPSVDTIACDSTCSTYVADIITPFQSTSYTSNALTTFSPKTLSAPASILLNDDKFSGAVPIGFPFCFYQNTYNQLYVSANGMLSFNSNYANGNCSFDTQTPLPYFNATFPDNAIFGPFVDGNTSQGGTIQYATVGIAPERTFIVKYSNVPLFGPTCNGATVTFQIELNETYNTIECHIFNKPTCDNNPANWLNYATMGVQNIGATAFHAVAGKNASIWTATNQSWIITPNGAPAWSTTWYNHLGQIQASNTVQHTYCYTSYPKTVYLKYQLFCPAVTVWDTLTLTKNAPKIDSIKITPSPCENIPGGVVTVYAQGNPTPLTYSVGGTPYSTNNTVSNLYYGVKIVSVKDANGCKTDTIINIPVTSTLQIIYDSIDLPDCPINNGGLWAHAIGGVPPYQYQWSTGATGTTFITGLGPGVYYLVVTDSQGCKDSVGVNLVFENLPNITSVITKAVCGQANGAIDITPTTGTAPYSYLWSNGDTTQDLTNIPPGPYTLTLTDAFGCTRYHSLMVFDTLSIVLDTLKNHTTCGYSDGSIILTPSQGLAPYSFSWSNGTTSSSNTNLPAGTYSVTVTAANGCTKSASYVINPSPGIIIMASYANAYCDSLNGVINLTISGNSGSYNAQWNSGAVGTQLTNLAPGNYIVTITDSAGCQAKDTVAIGDDGVPRLNILSYQAPACYGDSSGSVTLGGFSGVAPYKFSLDGINYSTAAQINNISGGTYVIYIRDANSCISDTLIYLSQPDKIQLNAQYKDTLVCYHDTVSITLSASLGKSPYLYKINSSDWSANTSYTGLQGGVHVIQVKDSLGCVVMDTIVIHRPQSPLSVMIDKTDIPCYENNKGSLFAQTSGGWSPYALQWSNGSSSSLQTSLPLGTYSITVKDAKGCIVTSAVKIEQLQCCDVFFPDAFTPNGDNNNDFFKPITASEVSSITFRIYNRWGNKVFESRDVTQGWDGSLHGAKAATDTYYYFAEYICPHLKEKKLIKGDLLLIR